MNDISAMDAHPLDAYDGARTAPVAQLDRVLPSEGRGRGFESRLVHHIQKGPKLALGAFFAFSLSRSSSLPTFFAHRTDSRPGVSLACRFSRAKDVVFSGAVTF